MLTSLTPISPTVILMFSALTGVDINRRGSGDYSGNASGVLIGVDTRW